MVRWQALLQFSASLDWTQISVDLRLDAFVIWSLPCVLSLGSLLLFNEVLVNIGEHLLNALEHLDADVLRVTLALQSRQF